MEQKHDQAPPVMPAATSNLSTPTTSAQALNVDLPPSEAVAVARS